MPTADDVKRRVLGRGARGYAYCDNNPVNFADPTGCEPVALASGNIVAAAPVQVAASPGQGFGSNLSVALLAAKNRTDTDGTDQDVYIYREYQFNPSQRGASAVWQEVEFDFWCYGAGDMRLKHHQRSFQEFFVITEDPRMSITPPGGSTIYYERVPQHDYHAIPKPGGTLFPGQAIMMPPTTEYCTFRMQFTAFEVMTFLENGVVVPRNKIMVPRDHAEAGKKYSYKDPLPDSKWEMDVTYYWCCGLGKRPCCKTQLVGILSGSEIYKKV
jgi:hypothetical protein